MRLRATKKLGIAAGASVSLVFGALAVRDVDFGVFWSGVTSMEYLWLVPAVLALAATVYVRILRWLLLFTPGSRPPVGAASTAVLIGLFFNQILPLRAGEAARVVALNRDAGTSRAEALGTAVVERANDVVVLLLLLFVATPFLPAVTWIRGAAVFAAVFVIAVLAVATVLVVFGTRSLAFLLRPLAIVPAMTPERRAAAAVRLDDGLRGLHRPRLVVASAAVTLSSWLLAAVSYWCVLVGFDLDVGFGAAVLTVVATNLALVIPSLPAGLGVFEAATILALGAYGIGESRALACAVVLHAVNFFPYLLVGAIALYRHSSRRLPASEFGQR